MSIKFGSDGFRGIIGHEFTLESVVRISSAVAQVFPHSTVPIGYDTRFLSQRAAGWVAETLAFLNLSPQLSIQPCTSPYLAFCTWYSGSPIGIQVTASHNPYYYNGLKLKAGYGGSLGGEAVKQIERLANLSAPATSIRQGGTQFETLNLLKEYEESIVAAAGGRSTNAVIVDYMHGASASTYGALLPRLVGNITSLRTQPEPLFGGGKPEPLAHLLGDLRSRVITANSAGESTIGLAFDGDGDRLAVFDETGTYLRSHEIFALLLLFMIHKARPGNRVVTSVSFASLPKRVAIAHGLEVVEVPVGFKHVSMEMMKGDVLIGGEESGGAAFGNYLPERDALLMALTLLLAKEEAGVTLHEMVRDLYGTFSFTEHAHITFPRRQDYRWQSEKLVERIKAQPVQVLKIDFTDGVKFTTPDGWILIRCSGTEPLLRIYAEAGDSETLQLYVGIARNLIGDALD